MASNTIIFHHLVDRHLPSRCCLPNPIRTMPLASSVGSSKRSIASSDSGRPTKHQRRLSLPMSADSSTAVNTKKVQRRRSLRRQSIASSKENPHFSPPETRSAKKKRLNAEFMQGGAGAMLTFSPPNQKENARREKEEIERKESERYV